MFVESSSKFSPLDASISSIAHLDSAHLLYAHAAQRARATQVLEVQSTALGAFKQTIEESHETLQTMSSFQKRHS
jgi:hypothetical protein